MVWGTKAVNALSSMSLRSYSIRDNPDDAMHVLNQGNLIQEDPVASFVLKAQGGTQVYCIPDPIQVFLKIINTAMEYVASGCSKTTFISILALTIVPSMG